MAQRERLTTSAERTAFEDVKRICHAGLDSVTLRMELARRAMGVVPFEAYSFSTTDPDTGLLTHAVGDGVPLRFVQAYLRDLYPYEDAPITLDRVRTGQTVGINTSDGLREVLSLEGLAHELKVLPSTNGDLWGSWCLMREKGSPGFSDRELRFLRVIVPHVAEGLRNAVLVDQALDSHAWLPEEAAPTGVIVLDSRGRVSLRNPAATLHLDDLADSGIATLEGVPFAVVSVVARLRFLNGTSAELRVRGRSGRWYVLRASLAEPDVTGCSSTVVLIEPVGPREIAPLLARLYGLTPREREVIRLAARGFSTKRIAAQLEVSTHTIQAHLDRACERVGVRGRKALLAKFFFEGHAAQLGP